MRLALLCNTTCASHLKRPIWRLSDFPIPRKHHRLQTIFYFFGYVRYQTDFALPNFYKRSQGNSDQASTAIALTSLHRHAANTGEASMTQPDAIPAKKVTHFPHQAPKTPGVVNLEPLFKRSHAQPPLLTTGLPGVVAEIADLRGAGAFQISIEDWDRLFRSIQWRLGAAAGVRLAPAPQADDRVDPIRVTVLECISAMEQLHTALTLERQNRVRTNPNANGNGLSVNTEPVLSAGRLG